MPPCLPFRNRAGTGACPCGTQTDVIVRCHAPAENVDHETLHDGVDAHSWPRFPGTLWQRNYYDIIMRTETSLTNIRAYIRNNPANCDVLRFGEPRFSLGNRALLKLPKTAFLASRHGGQATVPVPAFPSPPACMISGFLSPQERAVFDICIASGTPMIQILARGLPEVVPPRTRCAIDAGQLLIMTPFPDTEAHFSATRAAWCNQYVLSTADAIVIGHLNPDGMLACLLADLPHNKPLTRI
jgi:REP element-mobilizing transposase RayT